MSTQSSTVKPEQPPASLPPTDESVLRRADRLGMFLTSLPKWAAVAVIVWQAGISLEALASRSEVPSLLIARFGRQVSAWEVVCWMAGVLGVFVGLYSRRLLRRQAAFDTARLAALEQRLNLVSGPTAMGPEAKN